MFLIKWIGWLVVKRHADIAADVVLAEAAAWLVRLRGSERTPALESAFQEWMAVPTHALAFDRASHAWDFVPRAAREHRRAVGAAPAASRAQRPLRPIFAGSFLLLLLAGALILAQGRSAVYVTRPGQQQNLTLNDGTRMILNTDSKTTVSYSLWSRRVVLARGEAMFQIARDPHRPFLVVAGDERVRDIGTVFTVRKMDGSLTVFLVRGRVEVARSVPGARNAARSTTLVPGERLQILADGVAILDRPSSEAELAWVHGRVILADRPLAEAVAEINRYGGPRLELAGPRLADLRISGVFQTHDATEFASVVAQLEHLRVEHRGGALVLSR